MDKIISCEFNIDTACVEVKYADGSMISIDCTRVECEVARNMYEASELDWLVYNVPVDYVDLLLHGDIREYLKNVTDFHPLTKIKYKSGTGLTVPLLTQMGIKVSYKITMVKFTK